MFSRKSKTKKPNEIFTPKAKDVNERMYISRERLEKHLKRALEGTYHIIVKGDSGTGKTWLYKKVLKDLDVFYVVINLAEANRLGSIAKAIISIIGSDLPPQNIEFSETMKAKGSAGVVGGQIEHTKKFAVLQKDLVEECFKILRKKAGKKICCLIFDNLERIFENSNLMEELGDLIILLDDERYAQYEVKFIIVGVPTEIKEYFSKTRNGNSIANRITEIPEVSKLDRNQVEEFIKLGFIKELELNINEEDVKKIADHVYWVTFGIPQRLHEYCLQLCYAYEDNDWKIEDKCLTRADQFYLSSNLYSTYVKIEKLMNANETTIKRRDQVLFAIGSLDKDEFKVSEIEQIVRREFPSSTSDVQINASQILSYIAKSQEAPIKKANHGNAYIFVDPKFRMCLRIMLRKDKNEKIEKLPIESIS
ncbi:AAA family ATPase [Saccharococcus caldoxylosilyticus]|uniref:ORC1/DEAH AAA+ ATPase domain-containing protein n=1 Tax=Parageobacillus caldoxylosilyticus NBRC 107762 TaxID=1220594 RepID=A0A023DK88_9BACL|nr:AAA family ATPase [Parageobacillus caldoxylosilyticus]MBB3854520.1 hypothetical protein [Parageobacillus caldoxylosilyticus]GAJ41658.1 hypothetical protein GCA01S_084_00010 [Parageobacillus caldoxylosilyticus NBRC 107762]